MVESEAPAYPLAPRAAADPTCSWACLTFLLPLIKLNIANKNRRDDI